MADAAERDKMRRRRRRGGRKERERERELSQPTQPNKPPIILAKPPAERPQPHSPQVFPYQSSSSSESSTDKPVSGVVVLACRGEEVHAASSPPVTSDAMSSHTPTYQIHRNPTGSTPAPVILEGHKGSSASRLAPPPDMAQSLKVVDDLMQWCDGGIEMLLDQTDFMTVGVLGAQGSGKSTLLSMLAGNTPVDPQKSYVFRPQTKEAQEVGAHHTLGVDMYVTRERLILLDSQAMLSSSVLDHMVHHDKKYPSEYLSAENCIEMQSLQIATFMLTVCNVVLITMDWFADANIFRFLQTAEMLKPPTPASSHEASSSAEDWPEYFPQVVFVLNKAEREDFTIEHYTAMQRTISSVFHQSKLKLKGILTMANGQLLPGITHSNIEDDANLFILPTIESNITADSDGIFGFIPEYRGHPSYDHIVQVFTNQILSIPRHPLTHTTLSEKNWFHYAARTWEAVKKSQLLSEYNRLLP